MIRPKHANEWAQTKTCLRCVFGLTDFFTVWYIQGCFRSLRLGLIGFFFCFIRGRLLLHDKWLLDC